MYVVYSELTAPKRHAAPVAPVTPRSVADNTSGRYIHIHIHKDTIIHIYYYYTHIRLYTVYEPYTILIYTPSALSYHHPLPLPLSLYIYTYRSNTGFDRSPTTAGTVADSTEADIPLPTRLPVRRRSTLLTPEQLGLGPISALHTSTSNTTSISSSRKGTTYSPSTTAHRGAGSKLRKTLEKVNK